jgi:hypothetical protein
MIPVAQVKFVVGLSNGENLTEGEGILSIIPGEDSPWWKLQKHLKENGLKITSMSLYSKTEVGNRHYHLPNDTNKFDGEVPIGYNCFRRYSGDVLGTGQNYEHYTCMEAEYTDFKVQLYVSERDPDKVWINIVSKKNG